MDALVELLPLLFIGLYYLLAARRRSNKAKQARAVAPQTELVADEPSAPTPFQHFLEQLEAAAAEAAGTPPAEPEPEPMLTSKPLPEPPRSHWGAEFNAVEGSFDGVRPVDHDRHGFGRENPLSEEAFEQAPAFAPRRPTRARDYDPHGLRPSGVPHELGPDWRRSLRDPQAAREAFVLQTIFGRRGGRRSENR